MPPNWSAALGLREQLVGVSHECDYPPSVVGLPILTSSRIPEGLSSDEIDKLVTDQLKNDQALYDLIMDTLIELATGFDCHPGTLRCLRGVGE